MRRTLILTLFAILLSGGPGAVFLACADTAGERVSFETIAISESTRFTNAFGWEVTLDEALLATGPFYYFEGATGHAQRPLLMKRALAHPGHYVAGDAHGEMTTPWTIDLLARNVLPRGRGVTGTLRSARVGFGSPPSGPHAGALGSNVVRVAGRATKGSATVSFHATAGLDQVADADGHPQVGPCEFREADVTGDGTVTLTIKPSVWLDQLALEGVNGDLAGAPSVYNAFARGLKKSTAYTFSFEAR